jgi:hypothetical protein
MSKDFMLKHTQGSDIPEASRIGLANGVAGMVSNLVSCVYFVPLDVVSNLCRCFRFALPFLKFGILLKLNQQL